jgi:zinc protease
MTLFLLACLACLAPLRAKSPQLPPSPPLRLEIPAFGEKQLSCGLKVLWREDAELPLVSCSLRIPGGFILEPEGKEGLLHLLKGLLRDGGAGALSPARFDQALDDRAASLWAAADQESFSAGFSCLSEDVDPLLGLFADMLLRPRLDAQRLEVTRAGMLDYLQRLEEQPEEVTGMLITRGYFGPHGYGGWPSVKSIKSIQRSDLADFFQAHYGPQGGVLVLSGLFDHEKTLARLESLFKGWKPQRPSQAPPAPPLQGKRILFFPKEVPQVSIRLALPGLKRHDPADFPLMLANYSFGGGGFNSRLMRRIRSEKGLAYSISSNYQKLWVPGPFTIEGATRPDAARGYLELLFEAMRQYAAEGPTPSELEEAKNALTQEFAYNFASVHDLASQRADYEFKGYPPDYLETYRAKIQAVTLKEAAAAAARILGQDTWVMAVSGPLSLQKDLEAFAPVTTLKSAFDPL